MFETVFPVRRGPRTRRRLHTATLMWPRSLADFEHLANLLALENPASWIPHVGGLRSPFQIPTKPSRAALKDLQVRMDWFLRNRPDLARHSVTKAERATKRALKKRRAMITKLRESATGTFWQDGDVVNTARASPGLLGYTAGISLRPSVASIYSIHSTHSSVASAAATITEHDDEDTRVVRRLLLRKIDAQTSGAWDEIEKIATWHRVLKEVIRGVKRRAYL